MINRYGFGEGINLEFVRKPKGHSSIYNPEKLATLNSQDDDKQNKTHNTICVGKHHLQTNTNNVYKT